MKKKVTGHPAFTKASHHGYVISPARLEAHRRGGLCSKLCPRGVAFARFAQPGDSGGNGDSAVWLIAVGGSPDQLVVSRPIQGIMPDNSMRVGKTAREILAMLWAQPGGERSISHCFGSIVCSLCGATTKARYGDVRAI
jgi:hypothetical protein